MNASSKQVAGSHYASSGVQHWDYCIKQEVPYLEAAATKYLTRWKKKAGLQDLQKAAHYIEKRIESVAVCGAIRGAAEDPIMFDNFIQSNGVGHPEALIIWSVMHWVDPCQLEMALTRLNQLIEEVEAQEQLSGYVNQDA